MPNRLSSLIVVGLFILISTQACKRVGEEAFKAKESYGNWQLNDSSIGWIPTYVIDDEGNHNKILEKRIKENIENPRFDDLMRQNLFNTNLFDVPAEKKPWSAGFFPSWFDGVAGRWSNGKISELFGYSIKSEEDIIKILMRATYGLDRSINKLYGLSPMEKYDLVMGDYTFGATRRELDMRGHNRIVMAFWVGYCNGVSTAAIKLKEPFRRVDVINPDGYRVSFHPYDIKGLLGVAYYKVEYETYSRLGSRCKNDIGLTKGRDVTGSSEQTDAPPEYIRVAEKNCRGVNAATFVLALVNRLGIAKESFNIDKMQDKAVSNHPIGDARVDIMRAPYAFDFKSYGDFSSPEVQKLVDVKVSVWLSSTALWDNKAVNQPVEGQAGIYQKVGFIPEPEDNPHVYYATLELDRWGRIVGGEWGIKDSMGKYKYPNDSPDFAWFGNKPLLVDERRLKDTLGLKSDELEEVIKYNERIRCDPKRGDVCTSVLANGKVKWPVVKAIYDRSVLTVEESREVPVLDLREESIVPQKGEKIAWQWKDADTDFLAHLQISNLKVKEDYVHLAGIISGKGYNRSKSGLNLAWRPDIVRMYGYTRSDPIDERYLSSYAKFLTPLDDYEIWKWNQHPVKNNYLFRVDSNKYQSSYKQLVLFFYRWQRKPGYPDQFLEENGRPVSTLIGMFTVPIR